MLQGTRSQLSGQMTAEKTSQLASMGSTLSDSQNVTNPWRSKKNFICNTHIIYLKKFYMLGCKTLNPLTKHFLKA
jgi:hypothetical protein